MPELPEVETVKRGLQKLIIGRQVKSVSVDNPKSFPNAPADVNIFLKSARVTDVRRRAKVLLIDLSTDYSLMIHLKMTGQLVFIDKNVASGSWNMENGELPIVSSQIPIAANEVRFGAGHPNDSLVTDLPDKSTRVTIEFTDESNLYFNDQRKFGWMKLLPTAEVPNVDFMKKAGPEPLELDFSAKQFAERFKRRAKTSIKAALLDQSVIAGVGNIYADESLWGAKIHPLRLVGSLTSSEFDKLYKEVREVMNLAIEKGGSTNRNYVNAEGKKGSYMDFARVFRREGLECPRCGAEIIKFKAAGRGTHICPHCQVL
ncbi:MAG TPA: bifunctional DNA-formamidopyrimidine glycosylase/DNA-(apurinic or apyrimidinic site) lyase [Candidatus Saccharibacteria bacterium]|nr:bifunctional DNA-formamidopyrimidine glycosylase/DNA-(apurinic or apyrimidinic site) lyase [Candidatus Saccharibacteria bacterium]